jgi:hypothetical protein
MTVCRSGRLAAGACIAALALGGCASFAERSAEALAGCYQFRYDEGAKSLGLPWGVVLIDEPIEPGWMVGMRFENVMTAETATSATEREDHPFGYWRLMGDSVEIGHPSGFTGFTVTLLPQGRDLVGTGTPIGDAAVPGETRPTHRVTAYRVACGVP